MWISQHEWVPFWGDPIIRIIVFGVYTGASMLMEIVFGVYTGASMLMETTLFGRHKHVCTHLRTFLLSSRRSSQSVNALGRRMLRNRSTN